MHVRLLLSPYDSGHRAARMGRGPLHLVEYGIEDAIRKAGHRVDTRMLDLVRALPTETVVAFDIARALAGEVRAAREEGAFPLVLAGNCIAAPGIVAGLGAAGTGVLWLDAHGDLNTPETTTSGFLDGMAAAVLTGRCWTTLASSIPGFSPVPDRHLALVAARDLDPAEASLLRDSDILFVDGPTLRRESVRACLGRPVATMAETVDRFYLHVDLDVLDPSIARANAYAAPGGLTVGDVLAVAELAAASAPLAGAAITAFDPAFDDHGRDSEAATAIILGILGQAS